MVVGGGSVNHVFTVESEAISTSYGGRWTTVPTGWKTS
ncbi:MAG: hypothetical protein AVDCRST_MAG75-2487 [uncultured Propionibacteriaceae bacterium]|uniref:Uncharacterized protein n=1 Tax=uncultured Propionibacteriaceae bacterium TaxID=257457 RepID=A0A6J4PC21_9ACTN|nr:MAG: hypothetical protein AVDCRST_MAG75-2487 [uncultured Propionibacteriaceae bacterium]